VTHTYREHLGYAWKQAHELETGNVKEGGGRDRDGEFDAWTREFQDNLISRFSARGRGKAEGTFAR